MVSLHVTINSTHYFKLNLSFKLNSQLQQIKKNNKIYYALYYADAITIVYFQNNFRGKKAHDEFIARKLH